MRRDEIVQTIHRITKENSESYPKITSWINDGAGDILENAILELLNKKEKTTDNIMKSLNFLEE